VDNRILGDPGTPAFRVDRYPFYLLNRLASRYNGVIGRELQGLDLDIPSWRVLMILGEAAPRGVREIADAAVIPLSTMTRIVQRMAAAGLVAIGASDEDARVTAVSLLAAGEARLVAARRATAPIYAKLIRNFSQEEYDVLLRLLDTLYINLED
jgi:DNA-binding MarR family transcriptional regulator